MQHRNRKWKSGIIAAFGLAALPLWAHASQEPGQVPIPATHHIVMPKVPPVQWNNADKAQSVPINMTQTTAKTQSVTNRVLPGNLILLTKKQNQIIQNLHGFMWGNPSAPEKAVVFFDPNCIFCHAFFEQVQEGVAQGKARYYMVPVAILKPSSAPKAERIVSAPSPEQAFLYDEQHFNVRVEEGGLSGKPYKASVAAHDVIYINTAILSDLEGPRVATPTFIVHTPQGLAFHEGAN